MKRDHTTLDHLRRPRIEIVTDRIHVVCAVYEQQLDRLRKLGCGLARNGDDRRHSIADTRTLNVSLKLRQRPDIDAVLLWAASMRVDCVDVNASTRCCAAREPDRRLSFPRSNLNDHATTDTPACELVEERSLVFEEPAVHGRCEFAHLLEILCRHR